MTNRSIELEAALLLALEAMTYADACLKRQLTTKTKHEYAQDLLLEAGTAIKEALAQPEQEVVAWLDEYGNAFPLAAKQYSVVGKHWKPLYTTPPQRTWVGLTDEDKQTAFDETQEGGGFWEFADAIEAKLKEKNT